MARDFSRLNRFAHRDYKFAQRDSNTLITQEVMGANYDSHLEHGSCLGVVLNWVKEKMSTSNGLFNVDGPLRNSTPRRFANPLNPVTRLRQGIAPPERTPLSRFMAKGKSGPRNQSTMLAAAMTQRAYSDLFCSRGDVARELGLFDAELEVKPVQRPDPLGYPIRIEDETIARAG